MNNSPEILELPLSAAQYGIWLGQQLDRTSPAYWTAELLELSGELKTEVFAAALQQVLMQCETLHMRYRLKDGQLIQTRSVADGAGSVRIEYLDFSTRPDPWAALHSWMQLDLAQTADLEAGTLFGTALINLGPNRSAWYLRVHHIALDGFGYALLSRRVAALYEAMQPLGAECQRDPLALGWNVSLAQLVAADLQYRHSAEYAATRRFWLDRLQGMALPPMLAPPALASHQVEKLRGGLPAADFAQLKQTACEVGVDWNAFLIAAVAIWLHGETGANDISLGLPVMNRLGLPAMGLPCMAMNIVPLRLAVSGQQSVADLARVVANELRAVRPHQRYRYEDLKQDLGVSGNMRRLFGPVVNIMPFDRPLQFGNLQARNHAVASGPVEDISFSFAPSMESGSNLRFDIEANPAAYGPQVLTMYHDSFAALLAAVSARPAAALAHFFAARTATRDRAPALLKGETLAQPPEPVLAAIRRQVLLNPRQTALEQEGQQTLSYAQMIDAVDRLALQLQARNIGPGSLVAILLPRSSSAVLAVLAVLSTGAAYLPLDPEGPVLRLQGLLHDAQPALVLSLSSLASPLDGLAPVFCIDSDDVQPGPEQKTARDSASCAPRATASAPTGAACPDRGLQDAHRSEFRAVDPLAYVIYTSGSTGAPNGVMVGHAALSHFVAAASRRYRVVAADRILQFAPLHFDASVEEIFLALCNGATLVLRTTAMLESMSIFADACAAQRISVLDLPTAFWHEFAYAIGNGLARLPRSVRLTIIGGEAALAERIARWRAAAPATSVLLNTYGPTEATVICTTARLAGRFADEYRQTEEASAEGARKESSGPADMATASQAVPIGQPLAGLSIAVVDDKLRLLAHGEPGELCLMGPTLAQGYLNRAAVTAARFVLLPDFPDEVKAYRTGDRVLLGDDGLLRYLGRLDDEFKISGHRIEPAEVETALLTYPGIREAAVLGVTNAHGDKRLHAFLALDTCHERFAAGTGETEFAALRSWLMARLPAPAVPGVFAVLGQLPRNANGKIHRAALREAMGDDTAQRSLATLTAVTPLEGSIMKVWCEVLGIAELSPASDFFLLGGKSLQAIQAATRLSQLLRRDVQVSALFRHTSIAALAQSLECSIGHQAPAVADPFAPLLCLQPGAEENLPLFCVHPAEGLSWCYWGLSRQLPDTPLYGLQARGLSGSQPDSAAAMVVDYTALIRSRQPCGPYFLLGWSSGGGIAQAIATSLQQAGEQVALLAMMDSYPSDIWAGKPPAQERDALVALLDVIGETEAGPDGQPLTDGEILARLRHPGSALAAFDEEKIRQLIAMSLHSMALYRELEHGSFEGDLLFFRAARRKDHLPDWQEWQKYTAGRIRCIDIDSSHSGMSQTQPLAHIGRLLAAHISGLANGLGLESVEYQDRNDRMQASSS
ncbi:amino acid adenylation domain-containing protein [Herbaspirillum lusitanum]|uniref:Amino acid adenylation domain-containing protein n=1 Tax=Herbaspirillum lusitanum TaxID=213312 RepID=A0ABW9ADW9_9BURK